MLENNSKKPISGLTLKTLPHNGRHGLFLAVSAALNVSEDEFRASIILILRNPEIKIKFADFETLFDGLSFDNFVALMCDGNEQAGHIEAEILMRLLGFPILIVNQKNQLVNVADKDRFSTEPIFLDFDGEHYNIYLRDDNYNEEIIFSQLIPPNQVLVKNNAYGLKNLLGGTVGVAQVITGVIVLTNPASFAAALGLALSQAGIASLYYASTSRDEDMTLTELLKRNAIAGAAGATAAVVGPAVGSYAVVTQKLGQATTYLCANAVGGFASNTAGTLTEAAIEQKKPEFSWRRSLLSAVVSAVGGYLSPASTTVATSTTAVIANASIKEVTETAVTNAATSAVVAASVQVADNLSEGKNATDNVVKAGFWAGFLGLLLGGATTVQAKSLAQEQIAQQGFVPPTSKPIMASAGHSYGGLFTEIDEDEQKAKEVQSESSSSNSDDEHSTTIRNSK